jgi:hypothetical protein
VRDPASCLLTFTDAAPCRSTFFDFQAVSIARMGVIATADPDAVRAKLSLRCMIRSANLG